MSFLKKFVEVNQHYGNGQKIVFDICVRRWVKNVDGYEWFLSSNAYIVEAIELISYKTHVEKYPYCGVWDTTTRKRACTCLRFFLLFFSFLIQFLQNALV